MAPPMLFAARSTRKRKAIRSVLRSRRTLASIRRKAVEVAAVGVAVVAVAAVVVVVAVDAGAGAVRLDRHRRDASSGLLLRP